MEPRPAVGVAELPTATPGEQVDSSPSTSFNVNSDALGTEASETGRPLESVSQLQASTQLQDTSLDPPAFSITSAQTQSASSHDALPSTLEAARLAALMVGTEGGALPASSNAPSAAGAHPPTQLPDQREGDGQQPVSATVDSRVSYAGGLVDAVESLLGAVPGGGVSVPDRRVEAGKGRTRRPPAPKPKGKGRAIETASTEVGQQGVFAPTASTSGATLEAGGMAGATEADVEHDIDEQTRIRFLFSLDQRADEALAANSRYAQEVVAVMNKLDAARNRSEELQSLVKDMHTELADGTDTVIIAPGTMQITLPWHKHFHGQDLPSNPDSAARELYLDTIRSTPWTPLERGKLKKEVVAQNNRHIAIEAHRLGQSISDRLAQMDPAFFEQSTEFLDWDKISQAIPRRSAIDCRIQWLQQDHPLLKHGKWKKDELERLYAIVERKGERDWKGISEELGVDGEGRSRTPAECLRQFRRRTGIKKEWTEEEDETLRQGVRQYGEEWQAIALLVDRPSDQCINRWNKAVKPTIRRGQWKPDEDEAVRAAVAAVGLNWLQIARRVEGRTDAQCRERWVNKLDPKIKAKEAWSEEENKDLIRMRDEEKKSWVEISNAFDGRRTDNQCMRRYNALVGGKARSQRAAPRAPKPASRKRKAAASPSPPLSDDCYSEDEALPANMDLDDDDDDGALVAPPPPRPAKRKPAPRAKRARAEEDELAAAPRPRGRPRKVEMSGEVEQAGTEQDPIVEEEEEAQPMEVEQAQAAAEEAGQRKSGRQRKPRGYGGDFVSA